MKKVFLVLAVSVVLLFTVAASYQVVNYKIDKTYAVGEWSTQDVLTFTNTEGYALTADVLFFTKSGEEIDTTLFYFQGPGWRLAGNRVWTTPYVTVTLDLSWFVEAGLVDEAFKGGHIQVQSNRYLIGFLKQGEERIEALERVR